MISTKPSTSTTKVLYNSAACVDQASEQADVSLLDIFFLPPVRCVEGFSILKALPPSLPVDADGAFAGDGGGARFTCGAWADAAACHEGRERTRGCHV